MASLVTLCSGTFSLLILAASVGLPKLIVPNHPDLTIKVRRTSVGYGWSQFDTLYLKGARERTEIFIENPLARPDINVKSAVIRQCDKMRSFVLNERDQIYATFGLEDWSEWLKKARPVSLPQASGAEVKETIDSIDTGERRQSGRYTARHVKGRIQIETGPGASTPGSIEETDGWYIDLPGFGCQDRASTGFTVGRLTGGNVQDRLQITWLGKAPRGYPIEETSVITGGGRTTISKVELLEISEAPLNPSICLWDTDWRCRQEMVAPIYPSRTLSLTARSTTGLNSLSGCSIQLQSGCDDDMNSWKKYLLVRCKKRWQVIPASAIVGVFATLSHRGTLATNALLIALFDVVVILFPFHWGEETLS